MFYIFNSESILQAWCDAEPNLDDLSSRNEFFIQTEKTMTLAENAFLEGCEVSSDFTYKPVRPSEFHEWNGTEWVDSRTPEQLAEYNRSQMPNLTPIEFDIKLNNAGLYTTVQDLIKDSFELRIAYTRATFFSRTDPFINQARIALGLTDAQVDTIWVQQYQQPQQ